MAISRERALGLMSDGVKAMLQPGEVPLAYEPAAQFAYADAVGRDAPTLRNSVSWDTVGLVDPTGFGPVDVDHEYAHSKLAGLAAGGARGSLGDQFNQALGNAGGSRHILLTSHRFAIVGDNAGLMTLKTVDHQFFGVDRRAVRAITRKPRLFQRGRVRIDFADNSWAMAMMGLVFTGNARRLIEGFQARPAR